MNVRSYRHSSRYRREKKEVCVMTEIVRFERNDAKMIAGMDRYIEELKTIPVEQAMEILRRTGVVDESGKPKENIVSWA